MKLAVLAVALLVAGGSWEVYKGYKKGYKGGEALAQFNFTLPHFKCYNFVPAGPPVKENVQLTDQFVADANVTVQNRHYLCAPVTKVHNGNTIVADPFGEHLVCYHIRPSLGALKQTVELEDQFRTERGELTTPHLLCAPATKTFPSIPPE
jgi:hypothetical protein